jgi:NAD(P)-dependent dehydrogenase (short-subunit alcohol dehydrogenase family)
MSDTRKVAVVTGGSAGLGLAIARTLHRDGFDVAILGRRVEHLKQAAAGELRPYVCNVADSGAVREVVAKILADLGAVHALVNNAGVIRSSRLSEADEDGIHYQISVNLLGVINSTMAFTDALRRSRGSIVNLSSALAKRPLVGTSVYAATKGAVEAFTRAMALELGEFGIRVNAIAPGLTRSDIYLSDGLSSVEYDSVLREFAAKYVLGRHGEPPDVAELAAYLVSEKATWMTGVVIPVDGGYSNIGFRPKN